MSRSSSPQTHLRGPLEALVDLARSAREDDLSRVLETVAATVADTCGFQSMGISVYRPAWDDYEIVLVRGRPEAQAALRGRRIPAEEFHALIADQGERLPGTFFLTDESPGWREFPYTYAQNAREASTDPEAWRTEDGLIVTLRSANGAPLGFISVDEPDTGRRPTDDELRLLRAICSHAEQALESARHHRESAEISRMHAAMVLASGRIAASAGMAALVEVIVVTITRHLGFERVAVYGSDRSGTLTLLQRHGWAADEDCVDELPRDRVQALLAPDQERSGGWLLPAEAVFGSAYAGRSPRNGRGPLGWADGAIVVPGLDNDGDIVALVVAQDPSDHQIPSEQRCNLLRLLVDQALGVWTGLRMRAIHGRLLSLVLVREGAPALAQALAETIDAPVALLDWSGQPIAEAPWEGRRVTIPAREELAARSAPTRPAERTGPIVRPLVLGHEVDGYLVVEGSERDEPLRELAVEQAAMSFALQLAMHSHAEEVEHRTRGNLVDELLDSPAVDLEGLRRRSARLGIDLDRVSVAIAVDPLLTAEPLGHHSSFTYLARTVRSVLDNAGCDSVIAPRGGSVLVLATPPGELSHRALGEGIVDAVRLRVGIQVAVGVSRTITEPSGLATGVREAQQALRAAHSLPRLMAVALVGELELRELLLAAPRGDEIKQAALRLILPLAEARGGGDLVTTLATYLESVGQQESAARRLGIHINTLRNRIGKIEELLGRDLRDARTRVDLQLALELIEPSVLTGASANQNESRTRPRRTSQVGSGVVKSTG